MVKQESPSFPADEREIAGEISELNRRFALDKLDDWRTSAGLVEAALAIVSERVPGADAHLFVHVSEAREYREIDREGIAAIPEDALFAACLAMRAEGSPLDALFRDYALDDPMLLELLRTAYSARWVVPVVHRFKLLAFILVALDDPSADQRAFLSEIASRLRTNLYAASIADERQRGLLRLAEYPSILHRRANVADLVDHILDDLSSEISFDRGAYYEYDEYHRTLSPRSWRGLATPPVELAVGKGISGQTVEWRRAIFVPDRAKHPSYATMREESFVEGSFVSAPILTDKRLIGVLTLCRGSGAKEAFGVEHRYTLEIAAAFIATEINSRLLYDELEESYFSTVSSLSRALEAKDHYTRGHSERVMEYSVGIARTLKLSPDSVRRIRYAAILHDIGKIGISDSIITKPTKLTDSEFAEIKRHTEIGYDIMDEKGFFGEIRDLIRYHHEKMDGTGYYSKRTGDYPWEAMIISLADIYDALVSDRPYRKAFTPAEAIASLESLVDVNFDLRIFAAFRSWLRRKRYLQLARDEETAVAPRPLNGDLFQRA